MLVGVGDCAVINGGADPSGRLDSLQLRGERNKGP